MMQDRRAVRSSATIKVENTTSHIPLPMRQTITPRKSLSQSEIDRRNSEAFARTKGIPDQETVRLISNIPEYSKTSDIQFKIFMVFAGFITMFFLLLLSQYGYTALTYNVEHFKYGQEYPMTHVSGQFGLPGESKTQHSYAIALNQNGNIVVLVVPPDSSKTEVCVLSTYENIQSDVVPYISQSGEKLQIVVGNAQWYLVRRGNIFVQAQM